MPASSSEMVIPRNGFQNNDMHSFIIWLRMFLSDKNLPTRQRERSTLSSSGGLKFISRLASSSMCRFSIFCVSMKGKGLDVCREG